MNEALIKQAEKLLIKQSKLYRHNYYRLFTYAQRDGSN